MGKVFKYGENIDTDVIIPARHLNILDIDELARYCMEDLDPDFAEAVQPGDVIVAGRNFGCGSSREHAPLVIKAAGVSCVIAPTFARIFYRNAFNTGLPILESEEAAKAVAAGDELEVDFASGKIRNVTKNEEYQAEPFPPFLRNIIDRDGLVGYVKEKLAAGLNQAGQAAAGKAAAEDEGVVGKEDRR
jgi:3-isopropylmalate/(R)-2-methylmalate dehydratase small subunit